MGKSANPRALKDNEAKAVLRMVRISPRKLNLVAQLIRGKKVERALADLEFSRKRIAIDVRARRLTGHVEWRLDGTTVTVVVTRRAELVFSPAVPGGRSTSVVVGTASARLVDQVPG